MIKVIAYILWLYVGLYLLDTAYHYTDIWRSQSNPTPNVAVKLKSGSEFTGSLSREWNGFYALDLSDGRRVLFSQSQFSEMRMGSQEKVQLSMFESFIYMLPVAVVMTVWFALFLMVGYWWSRHDSRLKTSSSRPS